MRKISFVATRPKKFKIGAWLIMKYMGSDYSHVAFLFHSSRSDEKFYPYEATGHNKVNFLGQETWENKNIVVTKITKEISEDNYNELLDYAMSMCGEDYAFKQNIAIALEKINIYIKSWNSGKNCSELIKKFAAKLGYMLGEDDDRITPRQAMEKLIELEAKNG
jgi:hypothetical protein